MTLHDGINIAAPIRRETQYAIDSGSLSIEFLLVRVMLKISSILILT